MKTATPLNVGNSCHLAYACLTILGVTNSHMQDVVGKETGTIFGIVYPIIDLS